MTTTRLEVIPTPYADWLGVFGFGIAMSDQLSNFGAVSSWQFSLPPAKYFRNL
jgi:hypothetical protein